MTKATNLNPIDADSIWDVYIKELSAGEPVPTPLSLGTPYAVTLSANVPKRPFTFTAPPGKAILVTLTDPDSADENALYVRWGSPASPTLFDQAADGRGRANQRLVVSQSRGGTCHVLAQGNIFHGGSNAITVLAKLLDLALESISVSEARAGSASLSATILGAGFDVSTVFELEPATAGSKIRATEVLIVSSDRAEVVFNLSTATPGTYHLKASETGILDRLENAFQILPGRIGPRLEVSIDADDEYRSNRISQFRISYSNTGDEEMPAPLFKVAGPYGVKLRLEREGTFATGEIQALGIHPGGIPGRIPPGGRGEIAVVFLANHCASCEFEFQLLLFTPSQEAYVGWDRLQAPLGMNAENWGKAWPVLSVDLGGTWVQYREGLGRIATRLSRRGVDGASMREILRFAVRDALGRPSTAILGNLKHKTTGDPLPGLYVLALESGKVVSSALTDPEGSFALDWLEGGKSYRIAVSNCDVGTVQVSPAKDGDHFGLELKGIPGPNGLLPASPNRNETGLPTGFIQPVRALFSMAARKKVNLVSSWDPNEKIGPLGDGDERVIPYDQTLKYRIYFENKADASAQAHKVTIVDLLDRDLDWSTFRMGEVQVGGKDSQREYIPAVGGDLLSGYTRWPGSERYTDQFDLNVTQVVDGKSRILAVDVAHSVDLGRGEVEWTFDTKDEDNLVGFLLKNDSLQQGEAYVSFSIKAKGDVPDGAEIVNDAKIVFDERPEETPRPHWENKVSRVQTMTVPPANPVPQDNSGPVDPGAILSWGAVPWAATYDVYLRKEGQTRVRVAQGLQAPSFDPVGDLEREKTYHWQVTAKNLRGEISGPEWTFWTVAVLPALPGKPTGPVPSSGAVGVAARPRLEWGCAGGASAYEVHLWPSKDPRPPVPRAAGLMDCAFQVSEDIPAGTVCSWQVVAVNSAGKTAGDVWTFTILGGTPTFRRGDCNADGVHDISDAVFGLAYLFQGGGEPKCLKSCDTNDDGTHDISDAVSSLNFLFQGGSRPPDPFAACGPDPKADSLSCKSFPPCGE